MATDLTKTADANSSARQATAGEKLAADLSGRLTRFREFVAESAFGTNVRLDKLPAFERARAIVDARSYFILLSAGDVAAGLALFAASQGGYLRGRQGFEDLWENGRRFIYGAVNGGGSGVEGFGPVCLVLADVQSGSVDALGVFPEDTVKRYVDANGDINHELACAEATAWEDRAELGVLERSEEASATTAADWPGLLCSADDYLEIVITGPLSLEAVIEVRLPAALRVRLDELRAKSVLEVPITDVELAEVHAYDVLHAWRRRHGAAIEA